MMDHAASALMANTRPMEYVTLARTTVYITSLSKNVFVMKLAINFGMELLLALNVNILIIGTMVI